MSDTATTTETVEQGMNKVSVYTLTVLTIIYALNFMDRQLVVILQEAIKADLGLMDWQLGMLSGIAFALFYTILGIPIARMADTGNRRNIISMAVATWSLMTAVCGLANNFWQMFLARVGVGVGEAGCSPPAHSMISDLFATEQRATALSVYNCGVYIGIVIGFIAGGYLNEVVGWRMAFIYVGLPGVLVALIMRFTVREPIRVMAEAAQPSHSMGEVFRYLWEKRSFRHLALAGGLHAFVGYGVGNWAPSFFVRLHEVSIAEISLWLAPIAAFAGAVGALAGGWLADKGAERDQRWNVWLPGIAILISVPFSMGVYLLDSFQAAVLTSILPVMLGATYLGPTIAITHSLVEPRMRAVASAVLFLILNLIGMGMGPWITGIISDLLQPSLGIQSLRWALIIMILANVWCAVHYFIAARYLREDLRQ